MNEMWSLCPGGGVDCERQQSGGHRAVGHRAEADQWDGGGGESRPEPPEDPRGGQQRRGMEREDSQT